MSSPSQPDDDRLDPGLSAIIGERRQLINLAYRLLGSLADAEDVVQETYARWYAMSPQQQETITSPGGWLTKVASRICLDLLGSARARRERYIGHWLPEPLPDRTEWPNPQPTTTHSPTTSAASTDPADRVTLDESINMAFLIILESMTPAERVAFILHDVFGYPFTEIADIVGRTPAASRQLASSARRRIRTTQPQPTHPTHPTQQTGPTHHADRAERAQRAQIVQDFQQAWQAKDINTLISLLDPDATAIGDGGGLVSAELHPVKGSQHIAHYFATLANKTAHLATLSILQRTVNGQPGLVVQQDGHTITVIAFHITNSRIKHIWAVRNPEKLRPWTTN